MDIFNLFIKNYGNQTGSNDRLIKEYLLANWDSDEKILEISKNAYVSPASISRYIKKMRLATYKNFLRQKKLSRKSFAGEIDYEVAFKDIVKLKQNILDETVSLVDKESLIASCSEISSAECVYMVGMGYSRIHAEAMCMRLNRIGKKAIIIENLQELPFVNEQKNLENCVCISVSQTGSTSSVNKICNFFKSNNVPIIGICSIVNSPMGELCEYVLETPKIKSGMYLEAIYSEVTVGAILDFIYTHILFSDYEKSLKNYNITVDSINGKSLK